MPPRESEETPTGWDGDLPPLPDAMPGWLAAEDGLDGPSVGWDEVENGGDAGAPWANAPDLGYLDALAAGEWAQLSRWRLVPVPAG